MDEKWILSTQRSWKYKMYSVQANSDKGQILYILKMHCIFWHRDVCGPKDISPPWSFVWCMIFRMRRSFGKVFNSISQDCMHRENGQAHDMHSVYVLKEIKAVVTGNHQIAWATQTITSFYFFIICGLGGVCKLDRGESTLSSKRNTALGARAPWPWNMGSVTPSGLVLHDVSFEYLLTETQSAYFHLELSVK